MDRDANFEICIEHSAFEGALTLVSESKLGHSAFNYPRLGKFISLFNKI